MGNSLVEAFNEKETKHRKIVDAVKTSMGVPDVLVLPVAFGSRGSCSKYVVYLTGLNRNLVVIKYVKMKNNK